MPPKKIVVAVEVPPAASLIYRIAGALVVGSFVVIWISSIASPFLLAAAITHNMHITAGLIIILSIMSYLPWKKGPISGLAKYFIDTYHPMHYNGYSMQFEGGLPDPLGSQTFYAVHPHGAFCLGWSCLFASPVMQHVRFCFSPALYYTPFFRLFSRLVGKPGKADKKSMIKYFRDGNHLALPPGGFEEATLSSTKLDRVYIRKRTGFIKLCLIHGVAVVPIYAFGERKLFWNVQGMFKFRLGLNSFGIPAIVVWGASFLPFLPRSEKMYIVAGEPIRLPKIEAPTREEVLLWHGKYIVALTRLFEEHKVAAYGEEEGKVAKLEIW